ncbi:hypothetical protein [Arthrobacter sp. NEB 688]|uniref:hypothetical protein n=1 Tax=Arthrobacter sp. NEB 688 TaxID=904039 RepID=UPI0015645249|nr:hypothetical protein [Arthrobacter sp. NEB 688]QKE85136.1 hypothetical protein HL663_15125 [Arthrobacter sp. NEB 688]
MAYWTLLDELATDPQRSINELKVVADGQAFAQRRIALLTYRESGWRQTGGALVSDVQATPEDSGSFKVSACVNVKGIDFIDADGRSQVNPKRPDAQRFSYDVSSRSGKFVVTQDTLKGSSC